MVCNEWGFFIAKEEPHSNYVYVKGQQQAEREAVRIMREMYPPLKPSPSIHEMMGR